MLGFVWKIFGAFLAMLVDRESEGRMRCRTGLRSRAEALVRNFRFDSRRPPNADPFALKYS